MATEDALNQVEQDRRMTDELMRRIRGTDTAPSITNSDVQDSGSLRQLEVDSTSSASSYLFLRIMGLYA
jgi:hypothetical protein